MLDADPASSLCEVKVSYGSDGVVAALHGAIDLATAPHVDRELRSLVVSPVSSISLDLSGLTFIDSSGLRVLVGLDRLAKDLGTSITTCGADERTAWMLSLTTLEVQARPDGARPAGLIEAGPPVNVGFR